MRRLLSAIVIVLLLLMAIGCSTKTVSTRLTLPARSMEMQARQSVLVLPFRGSRGDMATSLMRSGISQGRLHTLLSSGSMEQARLVELEKAVGSGQTVDLSGSQAVSATVIVTGNGLNDDYQSEIEKWESEKCTQHNKKGKCIAKRKVTYFKLIESCTAGVSLRVAKVIDGSAIVERNLSSTSYAENTQEDAMPQSTRNNLCRGSFENAMTKAVAYVTPYKTLVSLEFKKVQDSAGATEKAIKLTTLNKLEEAGKLFSTVIEDPKLDDKERALASYNLALSYWTLGRFNDCIQQLDEAQMVLREKSGFEKFWTGDSPVEKLRQSCEEYIQ